MKTIGSILFIMMSIILMCSCEKEKEKEIAQGEGKEKEIAQGNVKTTSYFDYDDFITEGLVAYYPFNGNANDSSGNGLDGIANNLSYSSDRFDQPERACHFNGINSYIKIDNSELLNGNKYTICFWYSEDLTDPLQQSIISKSDTARLGFTLGMSKRDYSSQLYFAIKYKPGIELLTILGLTKWNGGGERKFEFAAVAFSETEYIDYFGGGKASYNSLVFNSNKYDLYIGKSENGRYKNFKGEIDDLLIYNRILTHEEIEKLYKWNKK
ncbi:MAG: LamG-like jellyroll fold domain-containing protein [Bacteroidota bacterium]|nr:LamG-like jellyroll fold domain-containing protein [Bacteroidota bacterium]